MATQKIPRIKEFPEDDQYWRVDWLGAVERNPNIPTELYIQVVISPFTKPISFFKQKELASMEATDSVNNQKTIRIGVGQLPLISIGSIWKDGVCQERAAGVPKTFKSLDISSKKIQVIPAKYQHHDQYLIPFNYYRFGRSGASSKLVAIEHNDDPFGILIPMVELLRFYYAVSSNLSHAIFAGSFKHDLDSIIHTDRTCYVEEEKRFFIGVRQHITDEEAWVISRILHSDYAANACFQVHDKIMKQD